MLYFPTRKDGDTDMHGYYWSSETLAKTLKDRFACGQFRLQTKDRLVLRGEMKDWFLSPEKGKRIYLSFNWLCEQKRVRNVNGDLEPKWFSIPPPKFGHLEVDYSMFYFQGDETRIKMWGTFGEVCRFFGKDDITNLIPVKDEFIPYWHIHRHTLTIATVIALYTKK